MKTVSLSSVAKIIMGQSPPSSVYNTVGKGLPFFQGKTDFGELYPKPRIYCTAPKKVAEQGDILISVRAPVGPTNIAPAKSCIGRGLAAIRPKAGIAQKYLLYFLRYHEADLARRGRGSTFEAIGRSDLEEITLPLPPLEEQKRIAGILARADRVRQMRRFALQMTDDYLQAVFLRMFGDPVMNPMGLKVTQLNKVCRRITDGTHQPPKWSHNGYPFLFVSNIVDGELDFNTTKFISHTTWEELDQRCPVEINDILYTIVGSYGNAALVRTNRPFSFQRHIAHIKPDPNKVHPEFLLGMLQSSGVKQQADRQVRGVAQKTLNLRELKEFLVFVPSVPLQERYVHVRRRFERVLTQQREALRQAEHLFDTQLHRAFCGEL